MLIRTVISTLIIFFSLSIDLALAGSPDLTIDQPKLAAKEVFTEEPWGISLFEEQKLIRELKKGGYVIYFRHTATEQKIEQWDDIDLQDCATQRNLSELGQRQGRRIGIVFSSLGIKVSKVLTSPFCRCIDTGTIAFGTVDISRALLFSVGEDKGLEIALRKILGTQPLAGGNTVLVSHSSNLRDAAGIDPQPEGVAVIFKPRTDGSFSYVATVLPEGWDYFLNEK